MPMLHRRTAPAPELDAVEPLAKRAPRNANGGLDLAWIAGEAKLPAWKVTAALEKLRRLGRLPRTGKPRGPGVGNRVRRVRARPAAAPPPARASPGPPAFRSLDGRTKLQRRCARMLGEWKSGRGWEWLAKQGATVGEED